jgi:hypothetical protein
MLLATHSHGPLLEIEILPAEWMGLSSSADPSLMLTIKVL